MDLFLTDQNEIIINEINTIPGFTNVSMFPMLWQHMGISYELLVQRLIDCALDRWENARSIETDYINGE